MNDEENASFLFLTILFASPLCVPYRCWKLVSHWETQASSQEWQTVPNGSYRRKVSRPSTRVTYPTCWVLSPTLALTWLSMRLDNHDSAQPSQHFLFVLCVLTSSRSRCSSDSEVCLAEQEQRSGRPRGHGAGRLRCCLQHLWTASKLPTGTDPHPNAGTG